MKQKLLVSTIAALFVAPSAFALPVYHDDINSINIGGQANVVAQSINGAGTSTIANNASRITIDAQHKLTNGWKAFTTLEWGVNIAGQQDISLNGGQNNITATEDSEFLSNRLGFVGLSHDKYGTITLGKQWGVWYDVVGNTDNTEYWGGGATGAYTFGGDGGIDGTGRADKAIQYRNTFGNLSIGLQGQLKQDSVDTNLSLQEMVNPKTAKVTDPKVRVEINNSFGLSAKYQVTDNVTVAAGYNRADITATEINGTKSMSGTDYIYGANATYGTFSKGLFASLSVNKNQNHEVDNMGRLIPQATDVSAFTSYTFENGIRPIVSYEQVDASHHYQDQYGEKFNRRLLIAGLQYAWDSSITLYSEARFDLSNYDNAVGNKEQMKQADENAVAVGLQYVF